MFSETQEHVLQCSVLRDQVQHLNIDFSSVDYKMIFGNLEKQEKIVKIYHLLVQARSDKLNSNQI